MLMKGNVVETLETREGGLDLISGKKVWRLYFRIFGLENFFFCGDQRGMILYKICLNLINTFVKSLIMRVKKENHNFIVVIENT